MLSHEWEEFKIEFYIFIITTLGLLQLKSCIRMLKFWFIRNKTFYGKSQSVVFSPRLCWIGSGWEDRVLTFLNRRTLLPRSLTSGHLRLSAFHMFEQICHRELGLPMPRFSWNFFSPCLVDPDSDTIFLETVFSDTLYLDKVFLYSVIPQLCLPVTSTSWTLSSRNLVFLEVPDNVFFQKVIWKQQEQEQQQQCCFLSRWHRRGSNLYFSTQRWISSIIGWCERVRQFQGCQDKKMSNLAIKHKKFLKSTYPQKMPNKGQRTKFASEN